MRSWQHISQKKYDTDVINKLTIYFILAMNLQLQIIEKPFLEIFISYRS